MAIKKRKASRAIKKHLLASIIIAFFVVTVAIAVLVKIHFTNYMQESYSKNAEGIAHIIANSIDADKIKKYAKYNEEDDYYVQISGLLDDCRSSLEVDAINICVPSDEELIYIWSTNKDIELGDAKSFNDFVYDGKKDELAAQIKANIKEGNSNTYAARDNDGYSMTAICPIKSGDEIVAFVEVNLPIDTIAENTKWFITFIIQMMVVITIVTFIILYFRLNVLIMKPLGKLSQATDNFVKNENAKSDDSDEIYRPGIFEADIHTGGEIETLSKSFTAMSKRLDHYITNLIEVTRQKEHYETAAYTDDLTRVKNKAALSVEEDSLDLQISEDKARFAIVMLDVNSLKHINDTYGHTAGDNAIIEAAAIICRVFQLSHVYRVGGDEFVCLLEGYEYDIQDTLEQKLKEEMEKEAKKHQDRPWKVSIAYGIAKYDPKSDDDFKSVYERADHIMYERKQKMYKDKGVIGR